MKCDDAEDASSRCNRADMQILDTVESNYDEISDVKEIFDMNDKIDAHFNEIKKHEICERKCLNNIRNDRPEQSSFPKQSKLIK